MFTDKFIWFPVKEFNAEQKELTGKADCRDTQEKIDPFQISNYRLSKDSDDIECISLTLKNGYTIGVYLSIDDFQKRLNDF